MQVRWGWMGLLCGTRFLNNNCMRTGGMTSTYQALDKPNSVGGDLVASILAQIMSMNAANSTSIKQFDNGQVPEDMTRFTEAG